MGTECCTLAFENRYTAITLALIAGSSGQKTDRSMLMDIDRVPQLSHSPSAAQAISQRHAAMAAGSNAMIVREQIRDLLKRYCARLLSQLEILDQLLSQGCGIDAHSSVPLAEAQDITHEMKGTSGSLGFSDIAAAASALDDDLKFRVRQDRVSQSHLRNSETLFAQLRKMASQATPKKSALYFADLSTLASSASYIARSRTLT